VIYLDIGLVGTFSRWVEKSTEKNYRYLEYIPLNCIPPKKIILSKGIHTDHIHTLDATSNVKGVERVIKLIYTGEQGSIIANILKFDNEKLIVDLREKNKKLQMQIATSKQQAEDAMSGVGKTMASMKSVVKSTSPPSSFDGEFSRNRFSQENSERQPYDDGYDDF